MDNTNEMDSARKMIEGIAPQSNSDVFEKTNNGFEVSDDAVAHVKDGVQYNAIGLESTADHKHVSKAWQETGTIPILEFRQKVAAEASTKIDEKKTWGYLHLDENLRLPDGKKMTMHGLSNLVAMTEFPNAAVEYFIAEDNGAIIAQEVNKGLDRRNAEWNDKKKSYQVSKFTDKAEKDIFIRTRPDPNSGEQVVRMVGSSRYGVINNIDVIDAIVDAMKESPYGGDMSKALASHTFDDLDNMHGNILFPDQMKAYPDSDYGVGLAFGNSEIGKYKAKAVPFLFRAICSNGCIWGRQDVKAGYVKKHSGEIDLNEIRNQIARDVIVALSEGNDLLTQMQYSRDAIIPMDMVAKVITYFATSNALVSVNMARTWYKSFLVEPHESGFGIINGLTRAAQQYSGDDRWFMESMAGTLLTPALTASKGALVDRWGKILDRANDVTEKQIRSYTTIA